MIAEMHFLDNLAYPLSFDIGEEYHILVRRKTRGEPTFCLLLRDKSPSASSLEGYP